MTMEPTAPADALPVFEPEAAAARLGGRPDFLRQLLARFGSQAPALLAQADAAGAADPPALRRILHTLAGTCATCGGSRCAAHAAALSQLAAQGRIDEVMDGLPALRLELQALAAACAAWAAGEA